MGTLGTIARRGGVVFYLDIPTPAEYRVLSETRGDACVSIYIPTTPVTQKIGASRIEFGNQIRAAVEQLEREGCDKRRLTALEELLGYLRDDDSFWRLQANSLAVLATPDSVHTFRLANHLSVILQVSDRFHLKPLLRALTFPHAAYVLALSENMVRAIEISVDLPPVELKVRGLPKSAADAAGKSSLKDSAPNRRFQGSEGRKVRLAQFARKVDAALRHELSGHELPLILAATEPIASIYRGVNSYPHLLAETVPGNTEHMTPAELAAAARPVLDRFYAQELDRLKELYERRRVESRTTTDLSDAARAATFGQIDTVLVDIDEVVHGVIDEETGEMHLAEEGPRTYGIVDEIAARTLAQGGRVLGVRRPDLPGGGSLAAILRFPM